MAPLIKFVAHGLPPCSYPGNIKEKGSALDFPAGQDPATLGHRPALGGLFSTVIGWPLKHPSSAARKGSCLLLNGFVSLLPAHISLEAQRLLFVFEPPPPL